MKIVSVSEMIQIEKSANQKGISYSAMMRNAGNGIAAWVKDNCDLSHGIVGLVGSGNNGGDTLIAITKLSSLNFRTFVFLVRPRSEDLLITEYFRSGGEIIDISDNKHISKLEAVLAQDPILLDGMLGTGFRLPLRGSLSAIMGHIKEIAERLPVSRIIAVDCPSGIDCDTGEASKETLIAKNTLTMAAVKQGLLKYPARSYVGEIDLLEIGIPDEHPSKGLNFPQMINANLAKKMLPERPENGHKGTFGTCLVIAGSQEYTGAAFLAGKAAYRSGCGLVNMATPRAVRDALAGELIEAVWTILPDVNGGYAQTGVNFLEPYLHKSDALVIGPGFGLGQTNVQFLEALLEALPKGLRTIIDADGLKLLTRIEDWWERIPDTTVLTPHPGEMSILSGLSIADIVENRWETARAYAQKWGVSLIMKGAMTAVGTPEGELFINPVGDSTLATAGSGDVLSGIIGGLMAQGLSAKTSAVLGVWLHAKAGLLARIEVGSAAAVTAIDILDQAGTCFYK